MSGVSLNSLQPAGIVTPEAVVLEFETAGAGSRAAGEALDVLLQLVVLGMVAAAVGAADSYAGHTAAAVIGLVVTLLVLVGYPVVTETLWNGRTLGKAALGLRVVTVEGGPVRFRHAAIRGIIGLFEIYVTLGSVALLTIIFSRRDQRLGDHVAGTIVLRERAAPGHQTVSVNFPAPYGLESYVASLDVATLSGEEYGVIRAFLLRVLDLSPEARWSLAVKLANATAGELHLTPLPGLAPEPFLACVAAAYQRRHLPAGASFAVAPPPPPPSSPPPPAAPPPPWGPPAAPVGPPPPPPPAPSPPWGPPAEPVGPFAPPASPPVAAPVTPPATWSPPPAAPAPAPGSTEPTAPGAPGAVPPPVTPPGWNTGAGRTDPPGG